MNCPITPEDPRLTAFALGELPEPERAAVEAALRQSPECRAAVEALRQTAGALAAGLAAEPCPGLKPAQKAALLGSLAEVARPVSPVSDLRAGWMVWARRLAWGGAGAAVATVVFLLQKTPEPVAVAPEPAVAAQAVVSAPEPAASAPVPAPERVVQPKGGGVAMERALETNQSRTALVARVRAAVYDAASVAGQAPDAQTLARSVPAAGAPVVAVAGQGGWTPLALALPRPAFKGTPVDPPSDTTVEPSKGPRPAFLAPAGVVNLALGKKVTSSDKAPITGGVELVTDGNKEAAENSVIELHRRQQWVQIDLEQAARLYAVLIWHNHNTPAIYRDVVVQASNDPDFVQGVTTLFNNDQDNTSGLGVGTDREYFESHEGKLVDAKGVQARYVRCYSKGSTDSALNVYTEIEVFGLPAAAPAP